MELGQIMISEYLVGENDTIADALKRIDETGKRCVFVVDDVGKLVAALADGDVRRYILSHGTSKGFVKDAANYDPLMVKQGDETKAKQLFDTYSLTALPVVDSWFSGSRRDYSKETPCVRKAVASCYDGGRDWVAAYAHHCSSA